MSCIVKPSNNITVMWSDPSCLERVKFQLENGSKIKLLHWSDPMICHWFLESISRQRQNCIGYAGDSRLYFVKQPFVYETICSNVFELRSSNRIYTPWKLLIKLLEHMEQIFSKLEVWDSQHCGFIVHTTMLCWWDHYHVWSRSQTLTLIEFVHIWESRPLILNGLIYRVNS